MSQKMLGTVSLVGLCKSSGVILHGVDLSFNFIVLQFGSMSGRGKSPGADSEKDQQQHTVDQLELQYYETQLEQYDTKFEILKNEEQLLVAQIDTLRRQIKGILSVRRG